MDVAKHVVTELVAKMPEKLRVTFVIYGYDRDLNCQAVQVARPMGPLDASGKSDLTALISGLRPVANTPIALAPRPRAVSSPRTTRRADWCS